MDMKSQQGEQIATATDLVTYLFSKQQDAADPIIQLNRARPIRCSLLLLDRTNKLVDRIEMSEAQYRSAHVVHLSALLNGAYKLQIMDHDLHLLKQIDFEKISS